MPGSAWLLWTVLVLTAYVSLRPGALSVGWVRDGLFPSCPGFRGVELFTRLVSFLAVSGMLVVVNASAMTIGRVAVGFAGSSCTAVLSWLVVGVLGFGLLALGSLGLGLTGLWCKFPLVLLWIAPALVAPWRSIGASVVAGWRQSSWVMLLALPALGLTLVVATAPETAFDPLHYHLWLAHVFLTIHRVAWIEHNPFAAFMLNASMVFGATQSIGGVMLPKVMNWEFALALPIAAFCLARGGAAGWLAALALLSTPLWWMHASSAYAEAAVSAAEVAGLAMWLTGEDAKGNRFAASFGSGLCLGLALGTKYQAAQAAVPLGILWAWSGRHGGFRRISGIVCSFGAGATLVWAPWLAKNFLLIGSPVHPFLANLLGSFDETGCAVMVPLTPAAYLGHHLSAWGAAPWTFVLRDASVNGSARGPALLVALPLLLFPGERTARRLGLFVGGFLALWAAGTFGWGRFLLGVLPALFAAAAINGVAMIVSGSRANRLVAGWLVAAALVLGTNEGAPLVLQQPSPVVWAVGGTDDAGFLMARLQPAPYTFQMMREMGSIVSVGDRFYSIGEIVTDPAPRIGLSDNIGDESLLHRLLAECRSAEDLRRKFRQRRIDALLYSANRAVTSASQATTVKWTKSEVAVLQAFFRGFVVPSRVVDRPEQKVVMVAYGVRREFNPAGRLWRGSAWGHLPGLEAILGPGDRAWARGARIEAARFYVEMAEAYPGYAWAQQRVAATARLIGRSDLAKAAREASRRLGL